MKKTSSIILALIMIISLALPCLAAGSTEFSLNIVSESDTELVISLDYDGGIGFQNFDFELKYNEKKLKPTAAYDGDGSTAFQLYAKKNGGNSISIVNKDINPIKGAFAVTIPFKVVQGKDMFVFSFQKLSKQAVEKSDVSIKFTTCQLNDTDVHPVVSMPWTNGSDPTQELSTAASSKSELVTASSQPATEMSEADPEANGNGTEISDSIEEAKSVESKADEKSENNSSAKKIIVVVAAAICMVIIIIGVAVFIKKKDVQQEGE